MSTEGKGGPRHAIKPLKQVVSFVPLYFCEMTSRQRFDSPQQNQSMPTIKFINYKTQTETNIHAYAQNICRPVHIHCRRTQSII